MVFSDLLSYEGFFNPYLFRKHTKQQPKLSQNLVRLLALLEQLVLLKHIAAQLTIATIHSALKNKPCFKRSCQLFWQQHFSSKVFKLLHFK
jgi:hypothetical protein